MPVAADLVAAEVASLQGLNIDQLRAVWLARFGAPPYLRSGDVLRRCLAQRIQLQAYGGDPALDQQIRALVANYRRSGAVRIAKSKLRTGAVLLREHQGRTHRVEVLAKGFLWEGRTMRSLSEIAREITGVRWNGPLFFGLRPASTSK